MKKLKVTTGKRTRYYWEIETKTGHKKRISRKKAKSKFGAW